MTVAALVLSVVAVLVGGVSAWYTRRQAVSTEEVRGIESARRQDEMRPILVGEYVAATDTRDGQRPSPWLCTFSCCVVVGQGNRQ
jgi:hypothetical protein